MSDEDIQYLAPNAVEDGDVEAVRTEACRFLRHQR